MRFSLLLKYYLNSFIIGINVGLVILWSFDLKPLAFMKTKLFHLAWSCFRMILPLDMSCF